MKPKGTRRRSFIIDGIFVPSPPKLRRQTAVGVSGTPNRKKKKTKSKRRNSGKSRPRRH